MEDSKAKEDALRKELAQKDQLIEDLHSQLSSAEVMNRPISPSLDAVEVSGLSEVTKQLHDAQMQASLAQEAAESYRQNLVRCTCSLFAKSESNFY